MTCTKRQRVVKRGPEGQEESLRCLNRACDLHSQTVTDEVCDACPFKVLKHVRPCTKIPAPCEECREKEREIAKKNRDAAVPEFPALTVQLLSWKEAVRKWRAAGKPKRTDEEVSEILETHCKKCSWYDPDKRRCKGCGCRVTEGGVAVFNKIRMATAHCPRDFF